MPLEEYVMARPHIRTLSMTSQEGRKVTDADLRGKHALLFFGTLKSSDASAVNDVARCGAACPLLQGDKETTRDKETTPESSRGALNLLPPAFLAPARRVAKAAAQRTGAALTPVFITLDATHDTVPDLRRAVSAAGEPSLLALSGDPDGVLACANKFRWQQIAQVGGGDGGNSLGSEVLLGVVVLWSGSGMRGVSGRFAWAPPLLPQAKRATKTEDKFKKAGAVDEDYVSNFCKRPCWVISRSRVACCRVRRSKGVALALTRSPEFWVPPAVFLVGPEGEFLQTWPRALGVNKLADEVATYIRSGAT